MNHNFFTEEYLKRTIQSLSDGILVKHKHYVLLNQYIDALSRYDKARADELKELTKDNIETFNADFEAIGYTPIRFSLEPQNINVVINRAKDLMVYRYTQPYSKTNSEFIKDMRKRIEMRCKLRYIIDMNVNDPFVQPQRIVNFDVLLKYLAPKEDKDFLIRNAHEVKMLFKSLGYTPQNHDFYPVRAQEVIMVHHSLKGGHSSIGEALETMTVAKIGDPKTVAVRIVEELLYKMYQTQDYPTVIGRLEMWDFAEHNLDGSACKFWNTLTDEEKLYALSPYGFKSDIIDTDKGSLEVYVKQHKRLPEIEWAKFWYAKDRGLKRPMSVEAYIIKGLIDQDRNVLDWEYQVSLIKDAKDRELLQSWTHSQLVTIMGELGYSDLTFIHMKSIVGYKYSVRVFHRGCSNILKLSQELAEFYVSINFPSPSVLKAQPEQPSTLDKYAKVDGKTFGQSQTWYGQGFRLHIDYNQAEVNTAALELTINSMRNVLNIQK